MSGSFKHNKARKHIVYGGMFIIFAITVVSMFSSFEIYKPAFSDIGGWAQIGLSIFCIAAVEGCFIWLVYGFSKAFSSLFERLLALGGIAGLLIVMAINIISHAMMSKGYQLADFQTGWLEWGAYGILIGVLVLVLSISLADPVSRLIRLELGVQGKEEETILDAKKEALDSERIQKAMAKRAESEAEALAVRVEGNAADDDIYAYRAGMNRHPVFASWSDDGGKVRRSASKR
jgi:hypothetical protein